MSIRACMVLFALATMAAPPARGATNAPIGRATPEATLVLSIERCIELALGNSTEIALGRLAPAIRAEDYAIVGERFTPVVFAEVLQTTVEAPTETTLGGAEVLDSEELAASVGLRKTWTLGTRMELVLDYLQEESNSEFLRLNPSHKAVARVDVTQPLLKGFGLAVNRVALNQAVAARRIADAAFEQLLDAEVLRVYRLYWELVRAADALQVETATRALVREEVALTRDRVDAGVAPPLAMTSVAAAEARADESVLNAEIAYRKASDRLLRHIRPSRDIADYAIQIVPATPATIDRIPPVPPIERLAETALMHRPELRAADLSTDVASLDVLLARSERRPRLDLVASAGYTGLGEDFSDGLDELSGADFPTWSVGLNLSFLFGGESRQAQWRQAVLQQDAAELRAERARVEILTQVRSARFDLEAAYRRHEAALRTEALAQEEYNGERDRLEAGRSTTFLVDQARRDLLTAQQGQARARTEIYVARATLASASGTFTAELLRQMDNAGTSVAQP